MNPQFENLNSEITQEILSNCIIRRVNDSHPWNSDVKFKDSAGLRKKEKRRNIRGGKKRNYIKASPRVRGRNSIQEWNMILPDTFPRRNSRGIGTYFSIPRNSSSLMESGAGSHVLLLLLLLLEIAWRICKCGDAAAFC